MLVVLDWVFSRRVEEDAIEEGLWGRSMRSESMVSNEYSSAKTLGLEMEVRPKEWRGVESPETRGVWEDRELERECSDEI